jgi:hypothetical protein
MKIHMKLALGHMHCRYSQSGMNLSLTIGKKYDGMQNLPLFFDGRNILNGQHCKRLVLCIKGIGA